MSKLEKVQKVLMNMLMKVAEEDKTREEKVELFVEISIGIAITYFELTGDLNGMVKLSEMAGVQARCFRDDKQSLECLMADLKVEMLKEEALL